MSEMIWTQIEFKVPTSWNQPDVKSRYGDQMMPTPPHFLQDIPAYEWADVDGDVKGDYTVWTVADEQNYGMASDEVTNLLSWAEDHGVPYRANDETKYEYSGETRIYDGKESYWSFSNMGNDSSVTLSASEFAGMVTEFGDGTLQLFEAVREHFAQDRSVYDFDISHLPEREPTEESDEEDELSEAGVL